MLTLFLLTLQLLLCPRDAATQTVNFSLQRPRNGRVLSDGSNLPRQNTVPSSFSPHELGRSRLNAVSTSPEGSRAVNNVTVNAIVEADALTLAACHVLSPDLPPNKPNPKFNAVGDLLTLAGKRSESLDLAAGRRNGFTDSVGGKRSSLLDVVTVKHAVDGVDGDGCGDKVLVSDHDLDKELLDKALVSDHDLDLAVNNCVSYGAGDSGEAGEEDALIAADSSSDSSIEEERLLFEKLKANPRVSMSSQGSVKDHWDEAEQRDPGRDPGSAARWGGEPDNALSFFGVDLFKDITDLAIGECEESERPLLDSGATQQNNGTLTPPYPEMYDPDPDATPV